MKLAILKISVMIFAFFMSCKKEYAMKDSSLKHIDYQEKTTDTSKQKKGYKYFEFMDEELNILSTRLLLPNSWERSSETNYAFEGPNDMRIGIVQMSPLSFYTEDPSMIDTYRMNGIENQYPLTLNEITERYFMPYAQQNNMQLVNTFPIPEISKKSVAFLKLNYTSTPTKQEVITIGLEWKDNEGKRYLTVLRRFVYTRNNQLSWGFINQHIESKKADYEEAKKTFIDAILSEQHNTDWLYKKNKIAAQKAQQQFQAHQARMNAIQLNSINSSFTSSSSSTSVGDIYSDILDINHAGYLKRSNMTSHGHSKTINTIGNRSVISNHNTGEHYNVESGSKFYWVNNNGKYFGTDNANYDPRTDRKINQTEWSQFEIEN